MRYVSSSLGLGLWLRAWGTGFQKLACFFCSFWDPLCTETTKGGFPKDRGPILKVPIIRTVVFGGSLLGFPLF